MKENQSCHKTAIQPYKPNERTIMNASIKKFVVAASLLAATCTFADSAEIVNVEGRGVGANKAEALKDAYRDAVERAVGMYVDAEQKMKNDELVEDQILTQSNAYIEKYEVVKENTKPNGLVEIRINAEVKKSALTKKLSDMMPKQTFALGDDAQNIHSRVVTKEKRNVDAAALLENVLKDVNPVTQLMRLSLSSTKPLVKNISPDPFGKGKERTLYRFRFTIDENKYYGEFLPPILKVLDQISLKPAKTVRLKPVDLSHEGNPDEKLKYLEGKWERVDDVHEDGRSRMFFGDYADDDNGVYIGDIGLSDGKGKPWCVSCIGNHCGVENAEEEDNPYTDPEEFVKDGVFRALVIVKMNKARTVIQAKEYALPPECARIVQKWQRSVRNNDEAVTTYNIVFSDGDGEEVVAAPVVFKNRTLSNVLLGSLAYFSSPEHLAGLGANGWYISPMLHCDAAAWERWIAFDIPRDQLPNIKSVTVELAE